METNAGQSHLIQSRKQRLSNVNASIDWTDALQQARADSKDL